MRRLLIPLLVILIGAVTLWQRQPGTAPPAPGPVGAPAGIEAPSNLPAEARDTLELIARAGEGSLRDALSVLERVLAFCGSDVADEDALQVLGAVRTEVLVGFIQGIASRDAAALLASLDALVDPG